jgi:sigma-B regulation protein RsbU (phosphoserine phosphatase)
LEEQRVDIAPTDIITFYTDGVTEAINHNEEEFGVARLQQVISSNANADAHEILKGIVDAVDAFAEDAPPFDDLTLVVIKHCSVKKPGERC